MWTTARGERLDVEDMESSHIKNTMVVIMEQQEKYKKYDLGV